MKLCWGRIVSTSTMVRFTLQGKIDEKITNLVHSNLLQEGKIFPTSIRMTVTYRAPPAVSIAIRYCLCVLRAKLQPPSTPSIPPSDRPSWPLDRNTSIFRLSYHSASSPRSLGRISLPFSQPFRPTHTRETHTIPNAQPLASFGVRWNTHRYRNPIERVGSPIPVSLPTWLWKWSECLVMYSSIHWILCIQGCAIGY